MKKTSIKKILQFKHVSENETCFFISRESRHIGVSDFADDVKVSKTLKNFACPVCVISKCIFKIMCEIMKQKIEKQLPT